MSKAIMIITEEKTTFVDMDSGNESQDGDVCLVKIKNLPLLFTEQVLQAAFEAGKSEGGYEQWLLEYTNGYHVMDVE
jgi:hypothetical protein